MTIILQRTKKGEKPTRIEYPDWLEAMNDGSAIKQKDNDVTVTVFLKGGKFDFE